MKTRTISFILFATTFNVLYAQIGGQHTYAFLNLPSSARATATQNSLIATKDQDATLAFVAPSLFNQQMHQNLSFSHNFIAAGIQNGLFQYVHHAEKWNTTLSGGMEYISYGKFNATDITGQVNGIFNANEYKFSF